MRKISFPMTTMMGYFGIGIVQSMIVYEHFSIPATIGFCLLSVTRFLCLCYSLANAKVLD